MLKFSQYIWIGGSIIAAIVIGRSVGSVPILIFGAVLSCVPAVASLWVMSSDRSRPMGEAIMIFGWTLLATIATAATGGVRSPAIILFAIGPLTAYVLGNKRLTVESAVLSGLAFLCAIALASYGFVSNMPEPQAALGGAAAIIGITQTLILFLATVGNRTPNDNNMPPVTNSNKSENSNRSSEKLLQERNAYFAGLSHDLRSPFTAILGYAETFKMNLGGNLTDKQVDQASIIHESAEDLLALVDDMMDLAKSEAGKLTIDPEPIHLGELGGSIMHQMQAMADRKNIEMNFETYGDPWAMADARLVRRIWQNLISNAIKYSEPGGVVTLIARERPDHAVLSVKDDGRGMSEEDLQRISKPFEMGSNSNGVSGTGLGLVNVKRFAGMHGGKVVVDTAPGKGARFQVILPKAADEAFDRD